MSWRGAAARRQAGSPEVDPGNGLQVLIVSREARKGGTGTGAWDRTGWGKFTDRFEDVGRER